MKKIYIFFLISFLSVAIAAQAQVSGTRNKMAIFTPLYLDNAFDAAGSYRFNSKSFPKNSIAGLEFYHGASMAMDTLNKLNIPLDIFVYDSKSTSESLEQQFSKCAADGVSLIIANCSVSELVTLARLGADKKITVINATVPNDANTKENPYFVVLNSTIETQIEGMYNYLKTSYTSRDISIITRRTSAENYIRSVFETLNKHHNNSLRLKFVELNDDVALQALGTTAQTSQSAVYVVASLDTDFGSKILKQLSSVSKNYTSLTAIGMPTWENISLAKADYKGVEIIYSTPFYNPRTDVASRTINGYYTKKMYARPSDLVFRGYGLTYKYGRLLNEYGKDMNKNLSSKQFKTFYDFDVKPVYINNKLGYYENKKLYYLKYFNGVLKAVN